MDSSIVYRIFIFLFLLHHQCFYEANRKLDSPAYSFIQLRRAIEDMRQCRLRELRFNQIRQDLQECGLTQDSGILASGEAKPKTWHWMAALVYNNGSTFCGGSLITRTRVLTAAHCINGKTIGSCRVRLGAHKLAPLVDPDARDYQVESFEIHPEFNEFDHWRNDIALIKLKEKAHAPPSVKQICLPPKGQRNLSGQNGTVIGWRSTENGGSPSKVLLQASFPIWNDSDCSTALSIQGNETVVCAGYREGGTDTCRGDSGGPLMVRNQYNKWMIVGVASWGLGCGFPSRPVVYSHVSSYLDWIDKILAGPSIVISPSIMPSEEIKVKCGSVERTIGIKLDAVKKAVNGVKVRLADNRFRALEYVNMAANRVWARGICSDGSTRERCDTCISKLVHEIWKDCENAEEAELWTSNCGIQYAPRRLGFPDLIRSSNSNNSQSGKSEVKSGIKRCDSIKLSIGIMLDAAKKAVNEVTVKLADNRFKAIEYVDMQGSRVWSLGMCSNTTDRHLCDMCITKLAQEIWGDCDNAKGAELWTSDCVIQYAPRRLSLPDRFPSSNGDETTGDTSIESEAEVTVKRCSPVKLPIGIMLDAAKKALHDVKVRLVDNLFKTLAYVNIQGNQVWAMGMCSNTTNRQLCDRCIKKLAEEIWGDCDNAKEAELWTPNCGIQYAARRLEVLGRFPSSNGNNSQSDRSGLQSSIKHCNSVKLPIGMMLDAAKKAVNEVKVSSADNRFRALEEVNMAGNRVWALGICWDGNDKERCDTCISQLVGEIWGDCDNAQEAEHWNPNCGIQYAARPLELPARFPSLKGVKTTGNTSIKSASEAGVKRCSPVKLPFGIMLDAAKSALYNVKVRLVDNLFKTLAYVNMEGNQVWAMGMCSNTTNRHLCEKCVAKLAEEIWGDCDNAKGAELWNPKCVIQYAFQKLVLPGKFPRPDGL